MSKVLASQGGTSTPSRVVVAFIHNRMEMGSNCYGFHNWTVNDSHETWFNHGCGGQDFKIHSFDTSKVHL